MAVSFGVTLIRDFFLVFFKMAVSFGVTVGGTSSFIFTNGRIFWGDPFIRDFLQMAVSFGVNLLATTSLIFKDSQIFRGDRERDYFLHSYRWPHLSG